MKIKILSLNKPIEDHEDVDLIQMVIRPRTLPVCLFSNDQLVTTLSRSQIKVEGEAVYVENPKIPDSYHHMYPHLQIIPLYEVIQKNMNVIKEAEMEVLYLATHPNADDSIKSLQEQMKKRKRQPIPEEKPEGLADPKQASFAE